MKINNFWGDLTDISAKKEALLPIPSGLVSLICAITNLCYDERF